MVNLAANARDAMPDGGQLTVRAEDVELDAATAGALGVAAGRFVLLGVRDTGAGMDEATAARASEPYFTTKERGKGTGLGLAVVMAIVRQAHGAMRLESKVGAGTEALVYWPRSSR